MFALSQKKSNRFASFFIALTLFLSFIFLSSIAYMQGGTSMWVAVTNERVVEGDPITVTIGLNNAVDVFATEFIVTFDPAELQVVDVKPNEDGIQIKDGNCTRHDITVNLVDNDVGTARYSSMQLSQPGTNGNCVIAYIPFQVLGVLDENTTIDLNFDDTIIIGPSTEITTTPLATEQVPLPTIVTATPTSPSAATMIPTNTPVPADPAATSTNAPVSPSMTPINTRTATVTPTGTPPTATPTSAPTETPTPTPLPVLQVNPTSLSFTAAEGGNNPAKQSLIIRNVGNHDVLNWHVQENTDWLTLDATNGSTLAEVNASVDINGLTEGTYHAELLFTSQTSATTSIILSIVAEDQPVLEVDSNLLSFKMTKGIQHQASQSVRINNIGNNESLNWIASEEANWLTLEQTSGTTESSINALVDISELEAGTYDTKITISSPDTPHGSPFTIDVTVIVEPFSLYLPVMSR